jgi:hypothetical protein
MPTSDILISILKISVLVYLIYSLGLIFGILGFTLIMYTKYYLILWIFGLQKVTNGDLNTISDNNKYRHNYVAIFLVDDFDADKLKAHMINGLRKIRRFRLILKRFLFNYYWKEINVKEVDKRIGVIKGFNTEDNFMAHCKDELNRFIDVWSELPFIIEIAQIGPESEKKGGILFKIDHAVSDGLGLVSAVCAIADNYDITIFPKVIQNYSKIGWFEKLWKSLLINLSFIIYCPYVLYYSQAIKGGSDTPLKNTVGPFGDSSVHISKQYELETALKRCKQLNITFNEMIMSVISSSLNKTFKEMGYTDVFKIDGLMSVGGTPLPKGVSDINMGNHSTAIHIELPAIDDFNTEHHKVSQTLRKILKHIGIANANKGIMNFLQEFLPMDLNNTLGDNSLARNDIFCSNVPGPTQHLIYSGCTIRSIYPLISAGRLKTFIPVVSYAGKYMVMISLNEAINFRSERFLEHLHMEVEKMESGAKND